MALLNERVGFDTRTALALQSAPGVPVTVFADDDILYVDSASLQANVEESSNIPTGTGSPYQQSEAIVVVGITPQASITLKGTPRHLRRIFEALMNVAPTTSAGPIGTIYTFKGFAAGIKNATILKDTGFEAVRILDAFVHTLGFNSVAAEALMIDLAATGADITNLLPYTSPLGSVALSNFDIYSHKESVIQDLIGGTPINVFASEQTVNFEWEVVESRGNSVQPNFIGKTRLNITGTIKTRLYADTADWINRVLNLTSSNLLMRWVQSDGKLFELDLNNVQFNADNIIPSVGDDGSLDDFNINFTARQSGTGISAIPPFVARVED